MQVDLQCARLNNNLEPHLVAIKLLLKNKFKTPLLLLILMQIMHSENKGYLKTVVVLRIKLAKQCEFSIFWTTCKKGHVTFLTTDVQFNCCLCSLLIEDIEARTTRKQIYLSETAVINYTF